MAKAESGEAGPVDQGLECRTSRDRLQPRCRWLLGCVHFDLGRDECAADGAVSHTRATRPTNDQVAARHEEHVQATVHADPAAFSTQRSAATRSSAAQRPQVRANTRIPFLLARLPAPQIPPIHPDPPTPPFDHSPTLSNPRTILEAIRLECHQRGTGRAPP